LGMSLISWQRDQCRELRCFYKSMGFNRATAIS
jgi:hypothetical protein